jgi:hypothetical protein
VQGQAPELYNFEGRYFFDLAKAGGGVELHDLRVGGQSFDPAILPGIPPEFRPYFGPGRGGARFNGLGIDADPRCVALAKRKPVYRVAGRPQGCRLGGGRIGRGIGGIGLAATRARVLAALGKPTTATSRTLAYCLEDGSTLRAAFSARGPTAKVIAVRSDHPAYTVRGLGPGSTERGARRVMRRESVHNRANGTKLLILRQRARILVAQVQSRRVGYMAVAAPALRGKRLGAALALLR